MSSEPGSYKSLRAYYDISTTTLDPKKLAQETAKESDRAAVVIAAALLEDSLRESILTKFRKMEPSELKELRIFNFDGSLGSFSKKINAAYALGLIERQTVDDLHDIREMRNACAHSYRPIDFGTPELANVCKRLFSSGDQLVMIEHDDKESIRHGFTVAYVGLMVTISHGSREAARELLVTSLKEIQRASP